ncbi:multi-sensor hybrid histidine kinase [Calothrix sp. NIES-4071]|nr:multi-sensor hybrid histidine kinase [Calothrix sp. NIES-4071]BAZ55149.1 multi-sensor hybrid histidine kinase [Calothrix sp. NIES-4105]
MQKLTRALRNSYNVAVIAVVLALLLTQILWQVHKLTIYPLFLAAVMVSSWYGGFKPGLLATVLSTFICTYFFLPPISSLAINANTLVGLVQFLLVSLLICVLNSMLRSAQNQAQINALQAQQNYERLRTSQENLRASEERYRFFIEGVREYAIFMVDVNGCVTDWNKGAERILGYQEAEIIGQHFSCIFIPEDIERGRPESALNTAATNGMSKDNRWHLRSDGTRFWANGVIIPLKDETQNGRLHGFAKILQDLTERKRAEEEREQLLLREQAARASAEAANRSKDDFLAIVSHELRTPMTSIVGWAGMLQTGMLDEERTTEALEALERNANLQLQLIEDLLDISRIVRGEISLSKENVDLVAVINGAIQTVQPVIDAKSIQLEFVLDTSQSDIWGDFERLQQVVCNLLSNAIKFTPNNGRVEIRLSNTTTHSQIQVSDTGIGISPEFLPYIFERFRQADNTSTRSNRGLGLGLAIARHIVELHGGIIEALSLGIGRGATFTIKLPFKTDSETKDTQSNASRIQPAMPVEDALPTDNSLRLDGLSVLVVDDEADTRQWISVVLTQCGASVFTVGETRKALEALEEIRPDVLISDIGMPGEDGYALMRKIRELEPDMGGRIPAVALTGYARVEDYKEAMDAGFQLHVAKPIRATELIAVVASLGQLSGKLLGV